MLDKFVLMLCRNCKIMWLIMTDKDSISMSDDHSFSTDPCWALSRYYQLLKWIKNIWDYLTKPDQLEKFYNS